MRACPHTERKFLLLFVALFHGEYAYRARKQNDRNACAAERHEAAAAALEGVKLTIGAKTSSTGTIFGSVNNIQIAEALEKLGHNIDRKIIVLKDPVKEVGEYTATIKLHRDVVVEIPFEVVAEEA
mgnify:CR=1 FL=1